MNSPSDYVLSSPQLLHLQTAAYLEVAGLALWIFDYILTFSSEVHWVWGRKWDFVRCLFTVARYVPPIGLIMTFYGSVHLLSQLSTLGHHDPSNSYIIENCTKSAALDYALDTIRLLGFIFTEGLLLLRTYAFLGRSKKLLAWLLVLAVIFLVGSLVVSYIVTVPKPHMTSTGHCISSVNRAFIAQYICLIVYECLLLSLSVFKMLSHYKNSRSRLVLALYRDSIVYISLIIGVTVANAVMFSIYPDTPDDALYSIQLVFQGILAPRILFNLRETDSMARETAGTLIHLTTIRIVQVALPTTAVGPEVGIGGSSGVRDALCS